MVKDGAALFSMLRRTDAAPAVRYFDLANKCCYSALVCIYLNSPKARMVFFSNTRKNAVLVAALVASLATSAPARAEKQACENFVQCMFLFAGVATQIGISKLKPTPPLVQALKAIEANDDVQLRSLLERYPFLSKSAGQPDTSSPREHIEHTFMMPNNKNLVSNLNFYLYSGDDVNLESDLRLSPENGEFIDHGYVLLKRSAERGNSAAVTAMLDAGVAADTHASGALLYARNETAARLLVARGARPSDVNLSLFCERMKKRPANPASVEETGLAQVMGVILDGYDNPVPSNPAIKALYLRANNTGRTAVLDVMRAHGINPPG